jgi:hypothetical protein
MKLRTVSLSLLIATASLSQSLYANVETEVVREDTTESTSSTNDAESVKSESESVSSEQSLQATQETSDASADDVESKPVEQLFACAGESPADETASTDTDKAKKEDTV